MTKNEYNPVLKKLNDRGWNLYIREIDGRKLSSEQTNKEGAVKELQENVRYGVWPKNFAFGDETAMQSIVNRCEKSDVSIEVPKGVLGSVTYRFGDGGRDAYQDSLSIYQGTRIDFIGLTLRGKDVQLFRSSETHINLEDFIKALDSLSDISRLVA